MKIVDIVKTNPEEWETVLGQVFDGYLLFKYDCDNAGHLDLSSDCCQSLIKQMVENGKSEAEASEVLERIAVGQAQRLSEYTGEPLQVHFYKKAVSGDAPYARKHVEPTEPEPEDFDLTEFDDRIIYRALIAEYTLESLNQVVAKTNSYDNYLSVIRGMTI
jgi:hypothetical protein